ncbi:hypothetical protein J6590_081009 [Homalodisca vitripennis]|nr:hypothetical protein J6590_081009 [Homalodisca vitripennis]
MAGNRNTTSLNAPSYHSRTLAARLLRVWLTETQPGFVVIGSSQLKREDQKGIIYCYSNGLTPFNF